jgi:hypothetical protein
MIIVCLQYRPQMLANRRNNTQHKGHISDIEHNKTAVMLNVIVLSVVMPSVVAPANDVTAKSSNL